jgi:hypothetical protein
MTDRQSAFGILLLSIFVTVVILVVSFAAIWMRGLSAFTVCLALFSGWRVGLTLDRWRAWRKAVYSSQVEGATHE